MKMRKSSKNICDEYTILRNLPKEEAYLAIQNSETRESEDSPIVVSGISEREKQLKQNC